MATAGQPTTALLMIDTQKAMYHPTYYGPSLSNPDFEENVSRLLEYCRAQHTPPALILHVSHISSNAGSPLNPAHGNDDDDSSDFLVCATPAAGEAVFVKTTSSAFAGACGAQLRGVLEARGVGRLLIAGWSLDHCVSSTVRSAAELGLVAEGNLVVVGNACRAHGKSGSLFSAETVHGVTCESLREFAVVMEFTPRPGWETTETTT